MTRSLRFAFALLAAVSTSFAACSSDEGSASRAPLAAACSINSDCTDPLVCAFRKCHVQCTTSRDCASGQRCMASDRPFHVCQLPDEQPCSFNSDCPTGQLCASDRQCRDQCAADRDCVIGQLCVSGTCAEPAELDGGKLPSAPDASVVGQICAYTSECGDDYVCRAGRCQYECIDTRDCASGQTCSDHRCAGRTCGGGDAGIAVQAGAVCSYTSECPDGLVCRSHRCDCECLAAPDCAPGHACQGNRCVAVGPGIDGGSDSGTDAGLPPGVLATKQGTVNGLTILDNTAFWTTSAGAVASCSVFGCNDTPTILAQGLSSPGAIGTDGYRVFVSVRGTGTDGEIQRFDVGPGGGVTSMTQDLPGAGPLTIRSNRLYFATRGTAPSYLDGGLYGCDVDACSEVLLPLATGNLDVRSLATDGTTLYFTNGSGALMTMPTTGGTPAPFFTPASPANSLTVDEVNVYFTTKSGDVFSCPLAGCGSTPTLLGNGAPDAQQIASDTYRVFWIALGDASNNFHDGVFTCDIAGCNGPPTELATDPIGLPIALDPARVFFSADGNVRVLDKTTCPSGLGDCDGDPANGCEAALATEISDCGACGRGCVAESATATCNAGTCVLVCDPGFADCNLDGADGCEAMLDYDPYNCGKCGVVCGTANSMGNYCEAGQCSFQCVLGYAHCSSNPADGCETSTMGDPKNCGGCGVDCFGGACNNGACEPVPLATWSDAVSGLATDEAAAYVSLAGTGASDGAIMAVDWTGKTTTLASALVNPGPLVVANGKLYALLAGLAPSVDASVLAVDPLATPPTVKTVATLTGLFNARRFALDTDDVTAYVGDEIYLAAPTIVRVALSTGTVTSVASDYGNGPIAAFQGQLFYQLGGSLSALLVGNAEAIPFAAGDGPSLLVRSQGMNSRLFFASTDTGIASAALPYATNNPTMNVVPTAITMALTADRTSPFDVYWVDEQGNVRRQQSPENLATGQSATQLIDVTSNKVVWVNDKTTTIVAKTTGLP